jgi:epsilon-lactone hydrolase
MRPPRDARVKSGSAGKAVGDWVIPAGAPDNPVMLFLHGGGMAFGWNNPMRRELAFLCKITGMRAFGVDFPLIPDHVYPAAHDACYAAYQALAQDGRQVVLIGESSGAVLALAITLRVKAAGLPQPRLCALISPVVDYGFRDKHIWQTNDAFAHPKFTVETLKHYVAGNDLSLPDLAPVLADLGGIAPLLVLAGESELCRSEVDRLAGAAQQHRVPMETILWPKVWHSWHALAPQLPEAVRALEAFGAAIRRQGMD